MAQDCWNGAINRGMCDFEGHSICSNCSIQNCSGATGHGAYMLCLAITRTCW